jgi:hypothetical protein
MNVFLFTEAAPMLCQSRAELTLIDNLIKVGFLPETSFPKLIRKCNIRFVSKAIDVQM